MASIKTSAPPGTVLPSVSVIAAQSGVQGGNNNSIAGFGTEVTQVSFCPSDNTSLCVVGNGIFKLFRYQEGSLKQLPIQKFELRVKKWNCD
jgi:hypothetical protein